ILPEDFHLKIYPFKVLLPEDLTNDILTFHMSPNKELNIDKQHPRNQKYDTVIIKPQHFAIFSSWIEKKTNSYYNLRNIPYNCNGMNSICCYPNWGPMFDGCLYSQNDGTTWSIYDNNNTYSISYSSIGIPTGSISVDDYEVFQVIKKK